MSNRVRLIPGNRNVGNIYINSADRVTGTQESFTVHVKDLFPSIKKDIGLSEVELVYSWLNLNQYNDTMGLSVSGNAFHTPVSLTHGNYIASSFTSMLGTALGVSTGITFTPTFSTTTGLLSIQSGNNTAFSITGPIFLGVSSVDSIYTSSSNGLLTLGQPLDLAGTPFVEIRTDLSLASVNTKDNNEYILARIPVNTTPGNTIFYTTSDFDYVNLNQDVINTISLSLYDSDGHLMQLRGKEWNLTLESSSQNI